MVQREYLDAAVYCGFVSRSCATAGRKTYGTRMRFQIPGSVLVLLVYTV
jgi:hypothetical protein